LAASSGSRAVTRLGPGPSRRTRLSTPRPAGAMPAPRWVSRSRLWRRLSGRYRRSDSCPVHGSRIRARPQQQLGAAGG
jgi:hypothetical protein